MNAFDRLPFSQYFLYGVNAEKRDQIDKKFFFELINDLYQMTKSTSILLRNFFLKKKSIWSLFPALTSYILLNAFATFPDERSSNSHTPLYLLATLHTQRQYLYTLLFISSCVK